MLSIILKEQMKKIDYNIDDFFHQYHHQSFSKEQMKMQCGLEDEILRARKFDGGAVGLKKALGERTANSSGHIFITYYF